MDGEKSVSVDFTNPNFHLLGTLLGSTVLHSRVDIIAFVGLFLSIRLINLIKGTYQFVEVTKSATFSSTWACSGFSTSVASSLLTIFVKVITFRSWDRLDSVCTSWVHGVLVPLQGIHLHLLLLLELLLAICLFFFSLPALRLLDFECLLAQTSHDLFVVHHFRAEVLTPGC